MSHDDPSSRSHVLDIGDRDNLSVLQEISDVSRVLIFIPDGVVPQSRIEGGSIIPVRDSSGWRMNALTIIQTSKIQGFTLVLDGLKAEFLFDVTNDDLILTNKGPTRIRLISPDSEDMSLTHNTVMQMEQGNWEISWSSPGRDDYANTLNLFLSETNSAQLITGPVYLPRISSKHPAVTTLHSDKVESPLNFLDPRQTFRIGPNNEERSSEIAQKANGESYSIIFRKSLYASKYGNATVFVGHHSNHGQVAVKVLRLKHRSHRKGIPLLVEEWAREVRALRLLRHPSIIRVIDFDARVPSIYMEYLPRKDLAAWLATDGMSFSGTRRDAQQVLKDMSSALQYLSTHGMFTMTSNRGISYTIKITARFSSISEWQNLGGLGTLVGLFGISV